MKRQAALFLVCVYLFLGEILLVKIATEAVEKNILQNEFRYSNGSHDQHFKQRWREGMIKCLDRQRKIIELECVLKYVYPHAKKDNADAR